MYVCGLYVGEAYGKKEGIFTSFPIIKGVVLRTNVRRNHNLVSVFSVVVILIRVLIVGIVKENKDVKVEDIVDVLPVKKDLEGRPFRVIMLLAVINNVDEDEENVRHGNLLMVKEVGSICEKRETEEGSL